MAPGSRGRKSGCTTIGSTLIGDSVTSQGERLFRTVACEKMVHSPTVMFAEMVWEHIGRFARDMKTGELIRL